MKSRALASSLAIALAASPALADRVEGAADVDVFHADNVSTQAGSGQPAFIATQELGLRLRGRLDAFDDRLKMRLRYDGREPLPGDVLNNPRRELLDAWVGYELWQDVVTASAGRMLVPGPVFLVIDGASAELKLPWGFSVDAFGGRRALSTSHVNIGIDKWLPAVGGNARWRHELVQATLHLSYSEDEALFLNIGPDARPTWGGFNLMGSVFSRPFEQLLLGGNLVFLQQGGYALGPTWSEIDIEARVINFTSGVLWGEYRPFKFLRAAYDLHYQRPSVVRIGTRHAPDGALTSDEDAGVVDPNFLDNRLKLSFAPFFVGWLHGALRHRLRPERQEIRYSLEANLERLIPLGFYTSGRVIYEQVLHNADAVDPRPMDRVLGSLLVGYWGYGFDVSTGVSYIERPGSPLSGRTTAGVGAEDLSPFLLEAQRLFFLRASYGSRNWTAGVDLERNIDDNEYRVFARLGGRAELTW
jgi:hypothetical protein